MRSSWRGKLLSSRTGKISSGADLQVLAADGTAKRDSSIGPDPGSCKIALRKSKGSVGDQMRQAGAMAARRWSFLGTGTYLSRGDYDKLATPLPRTSHPAFMCNTVTTVFT